VSKPRGFAVMSPEQRAAIASQGGRAAHTMGKAHEWDLDAAREAGRLGGAACSQDRAHMAEIGRRGGLTRVANLANSAPLVLRGAGDTTCALMAPPMCCRFLAQSLDGRSVCVLFGPRGRGRILERHTDGPHKGWLARLPECMEKMARVKYDAELPDSP